MSDVKLCEGEAKEMLLCLPWGKLWIALNIFRNRFKINDPNRLNFPTDCINSEISGRTSTYYSIPIKRWKQSIINIIWHIQKPKVVILILRIIATSDHYLTSAFWVPFSSLSKAETMNPPGKATEFYNIESVNDLIFSNPDITISYSNIIILHSNRKN